jgi:predicted DCC family thiol-disulfide oxidoreductase YuxK
LLLLFIQSQRMSYSVHENQIFVFKVHISIRCRLWPCTRFAHTVNTLDKNDRIDFISLAEADQKGLLDNIPTILRYKSFHLVMANGEVKSGSTALLELLRILPGGKVIFPIINYFPGGKQIVGFIYNRFSRMHDMGSCSTSEVHPN